ALLCAICWALPVCVCLFLCRDHPLAAFFACFAAFFSFGVIVGFFFPSRLFFSSLGIVWAPCLAGLPCTYRYLDDDYSDGIVQKRMVSRYLTQSSKYLSDKQVLFRYLEIETLRR